jgi:endonuclease/exonuclease/phosphatase family metal-dependent hydrolase
VVRAGRAVIDRRSQGFTNVPSQAVNDTVGPRAGRWRSAAAAGLAAVCCVLALVGLTACGRSETVAAAAQPSGSAYTLMQMNVCLSGVAGCYAKVHYPGGIEDAVSRIREAHPDAVTFNEACSGDVALIARQTGYHARFSTVIYAGKPLPCIRPKGRGLYGDAVLTRATPESSESHAFGAQAGPEQRRWLCVTTQASVDVCTAHLASHEPAEAAANAPQCAELRRVLARHASARAVIFGGDVNRISPCAPGGFWIRTDASAHQDPGSQQVYGTGVLRSPSARVERARHTDHDVLVVRAFLSAGP